MAGHLATAENWTLFSKEWESILGFAAIGKYGRPVFKHSEISMRSDAEWRLKAFRNAIAKHIDYHISLNIPKKEILKAQSKFRVRGQTVGFSGELFRLAVPIFINNSAPKVRERFGDTEDIKYIFDEHNSSSAAMTQWNDVKEARSQAWGLRMSTPSFESDHKFLPLQAADYWAGTVRDLYDRGLDYLIPYHWSGWGKTHTIVPMYWTAEHITPFFKDLLQEQHGDDVQLL